MKKFLYKDDPYEYVVHKGVLLNGKLETAVEVKKTGEVHDFGKLHDLKELKLLLRKDFKKASITLANIRNCDWMEEEINAAKEEVRSIEERMEMLSCCKNIIVEVEP